MTGGFAVDNFYKRANFLGEFVDKFEAVAELFCIVEPVSGADADGEKRAEDIVNQGFMFMGDVANLAGVFGDLWRSFAGNEDEEVIEFDGFVGWFGIE